MANGKIRFGKQSGGQLALVIPDGVANTEVIVPESGILVSKQYVDDKLVDSVDLINNQTIAGVKTFTSNIVGNISGNSGTASKLETARTITMSGDLTGSVNFDGSSNVTLSAQVNDNSHNHTSLSGTVRLIGSTGNDYLNSNIMLDGNGPANTIKPGIGFHQPNLYAGTLSMLDGNMFQFQTQFGSPATLANNITGNAGTANTLGTKRNNYKGVTDSAVVGELMWKAYGNNHTIFDASASTSPTGAGVNNTDPDSPWAPMHPTLMGYNGSVTFGVRVDSSRYADRLKTASGEAPCYACRAWVNFNGTGTVAIRASGNVSSVTDNGTGDYTVNFTTAMPDASYCTQTTGDNVDCSTMVVGTSGVHVLPSTSSIRVFQFLSDTNTYTDALYFNVAILR